MSKVWVVGDNELGWIAEREPLKVFKEKEDALDYYNSRHVSEVSMVEAELVWVVPPIFPLPASNYICTECWNHRPNWFELCWRDNIFGVEKIWCDICEEDTGFLKLRKRGVGPYCLLEANCSKCGKEMHDRSEPITDGAQDITYLCHDCYKTGYVNFIPTKTPLNVTSFSWEEFSKPREEKK